MDREETKRQLAESIGNLESLTAQNVVEFGHKLADREVYKELDGREAVEYYLMQKHNWLPIQVKEMSYSHLHFALSEEIADWFPRSINLVLLLTFRALLIW